MAYLRRILRSQFWVACFKRPDGRYANRSTRTTDRKLAQKLADAWEEAGQRRLIESQARKVVSDMYEMINATPLASPSVSEYRARWLGSRKSDVRPVTLRHYADTTSEFVRWLGNRAAEPMYGISPQEIAAFRDEVASRSSASTANLKLKIFRVMCQVAWRDGVILDNPAAKVKVLKTQPSIRRAFTPSELQALLRVVAGEWRGMVLLGLYTGQRLRDIATLTWAQIDLEERTILFLTSKTGRRQKIPLVPVVISFLSEQPSSDDPTAPVFPKAAAVVRRNHTTSALSEAFHSILVSAGLVEPRLRERGGISGPGRSGGRQRSELSFHSLRHTATTMLKMSGATEAVVRDIIGHESAVVSRHYTHVGDQQKREAMAKLAAINVG